MALSLNTKRLTSLALALLILMAVLGPVCMVFASSAMAMSGEPDMLPCDLNGGTTACPYARPDANLGVKAPSIAPLALAAVLPADTGVVAGFQWLVLSDGESTQDPPPTHLTPLRI